jgi:hypothetical protein
MSARPISAPKMAFHLPHPIHADADVAMVLMVLMTGVMVSHVR